MLKRGSEGVLQIFILYSIIQKCVNSNHKFDLLLNAHTIFGAGRSNNAEGCAYIYDSIYQTLGCLFMDTSDTQINLISQVQLELKQNESDAGVMQRICQETLSIYIERLSRKRRRKLIFVLFVYSLPTVDRIVFGR